MYARPIAQLLIGEALDLDEPGGLIGELGEWPMAIEGDCGEALELELTRTYCIRVTRWDRSHKYKATAIGIVNGDFHEGRIHILKGSPLETQLGELQWTEDTFCNLKEDPAQANHSSDCLIIARKIVGTLITTGTTPNAEADAQKKRADDAARKAMPGAEPVDPDERDEEPSHRSSFSGMLVGDYGDPWGNL